MKCPYVQLQSPGHHQHQCMCRASHETGQHDGEQGTSWDRKEWGDSIGSAGSKSGSGPKQAQKDVKERLRLPGEASYAPSTCLFAWTLVRMLKPFSPCVEWSQAG